MDQVCSKTAPSRALLEHEATGDTQGKGILFLDGCLPIECGIDKRPQDASDEEESLVLACHK